MDTPTIERDVTTDQLQSAIKRLTRALSGEQCSTDAARIRREAVRSILRRLGGLAVVDGMLWDAGLECLATQRPVVVIDGRGKR